MAITIKDVAAKSGVCIATVSRAFNNPESVSEKRRALIFQAAKELNYQPNALARGLITKSTMSIGILVPDIDNIFHPGVIQGIEDACSERGYLSYICNTYNSIEKEKKYINSLGKQRIDGFIFVGTRPVDPELNTHVIELAERSEVVLMFDDLPSDRICAVYTDEVRGAAEAVTYLHSLGHDKIALFNSDAPYTTYRYKQRGYEKALRTLGIPFRQDYVFFGPPYASGGYACMEEMCSRFGEADMPRAAFAISDQVALGVCRYCLEHGMHIGRDVDLVGFSGTKIIREFGAIFPTIDQQPYKIGRLAAETLIKHIQHEGERQRRIILDSFLKLPETNL